MPRMRRPDFGSSQQSACSICSSWRCSCSGSGTAPPNRNLAPSTCSVWTLYIPFGFPGLETKVPGASRGTGVNRWSVPADTKSASGGALRLLSWEPVSGIEPLTCRLQEARPPAPMCASCTDCTSHRTDGSRCPGIIWRAGPRTGPRPRHPSYPVLLLCVTSHPACFPGIML